MPGRCSSAGAASTASPSNSRRDAASGGCPVAAGSGGNRYAIRVSLAEPRSFGYNRTMSTVLHDPTSGTVMTGLHSMHAHVDALLAAPLESDADDDLLWTVAEA